LKKLSGRVVERMKGTFRLGIQKTLGMVSTHYIVVFAALAMGYVVADDFDDDEAQDAVNQVDAAAADLADAFEEDLFSNAPLAGPLEP
jgi:hypothetical protein